MNEKPGLINKLYGYMSWIPRLPRLFYLLRASWHKSIKEYDMQKNQKGLLDSRKLAIETYLSTHTVRKLQIGAGTNPLPGWLNTDLEPTSENVVYLNATEPFPFEAQMFDYVFSEHMIEHIPYKDGLTMVSEIFRVLKPGGMIRIATPDVLKIIGLLNPQKSEEQRQYLKWSTHKVMGLYSPELSRLQRFRPEWNIDHSHFLTNYPNPAEDTACFVVNHFFRSFGHLFLYDTKTLAAALRSVGFVEIYSRAPGISPDPNLTGLESHEKLISESINDFETMVVEAVRP